MGVRYTITIVDKLGNVVCVNSGYGFCPIRHKITCRLPDGSYQVFVSIDPNPQFESITTELYVLECIGKKT